MIIEILGKDLEVGDTLQMLKEYVKIINTFKFRGERLAILSNGEPYPIYEDNLYMKVVDNGKE